jgi:hypothetical protein
VSAAPAEYREAAGASRRGAFIGFVLWGLWWGLMDGGVAGTAIGALVGVPFVPWGPVVGAELGAVCGAVIGIALGLVVGVTLAFVVSWQRSRGIEARVVARRLPMVVTVSVALTAAVAAVVERDRVPGWTETPDLWAWLLLVAIFSSALLLGRRSARSTARWYLGREEIGRGAGATR